MSDQEAPWRDPDVDERYRETFEGSTIIYGRIIQDPEQLSDEHLYDLEVNLQIHGEETEEALIDLINEQLGLNEAEPANEDMMSRRERDLAVDFEPGQGRDATGQFAEAMTRGARVTKVKRLQCWVKTLREKEKYQRCLLAIMDLEAEIAILEVPKFEPHMVEVFKRFERSSASYDLMDDMTAELPSVITFDCLYTLLADLNGILGEVTIQQRSIPRDFQSLHTRLINVLLKCYEGKNKIREFEANIPGIRPLNRKHYYRRLNRVWKAPEIKYRRKPAPPWTSVSHGRTSTGQVQLRTLVPDLPDPPRAQRAQPKDASLALGIVGSQPASKALSTPRPQNATIAPSTPRPKRATLPPTTPSTARESARSESVTPKQMGREIISTPRHFYERGGSSTGARNPFTGPLAYKSTNITSSRNASSDTNSTSSISSDQGANIGSLLQGIEKCLARAGEN